MENFEFKGDWKFPYHLPKLAHQTHSGNEYWRDLGDKVRKGLVYVTLEDDISENPDPLPAQFVALASLAYISIV